MSKAKSVESRDMVDTVEIYIQAGRGGDGLFALDSGQKANGGDGGNGGNIYFEGTTNVFDLSSFDSLKVYKAEDGYRGERLKRKGRDGEDLTIFVPLVTKVFDTNGKILGEIKKSGERVKVLDGGNGGLGNFALRGDSWEGKYSRERGDKSEKVKISLELNLRADCIFLGYPNAGKSSLINALTNARYRVAPYEFTTLQPQLGVMNGHILMDLPGLIEGTYMGKGLGTEFVKHTKYAKLLIHCVSLESENVLEVYTSMREEFKRISKELYSLPELIVFTKSDIYSLDQIEEKREDLKKDFKDFLIVSTFKNEDINTLKDELEKRLSSIS